MSDLSPSLFDALEHPKTCAPDDFWGQVRRTVNGKPVSQAQIDLIRNALSEALSFEKKDVLLDLCCGNAALSSVFFDKISGYLGVDMSPCLLEIAEKNFQILPTHRFTLKKAGEYVLGEVLPQRFTKVLCYGAFALLSPTEAQLVLSGLRNRFQGVQTVFIGNIPDTTRSSTFFMDRKSLPLDDHTTSLGKWYTPDEFSIMAEACGWRVECSIMPDHYYQSHYRFNATLSPKI